MSGQRWDAMTVREYTDKFGTQKSHWTKIGSAFTNKDGSIGLQLDCMPFDGKIILQIPLTKEEREAKYRGGNVNARGGQGGGYQQQRGFQGNRQPPQQQGNAQRYQQRPTQAPEYVPEESGQTGNYPAANDDGELPFDQ